MYQSLDNHERLRKNLFVMISDSCFAIVPSFCAHTHFCPGSDNFPFQFKLPEGIPGCYGNPPGTPKEEREKGAGLSYIQYKLTSQCDVKASSRYPALAILRTRALTRSASAV